MRDATAPWIQTYSGRTFDFYNPSAGQIDIVDIAHSLGRLCRFTGHTEIFYSVAQHCVLVSQQLPPQLRLWGLLHDAAEAYLGDVASPLKTLLPMYRHLERHVEETIWKRYGLTGPLPLEVKVADRKMLVTEAEQLMKDHPKAWGVEATPYDIKISPWTSSAAEYEFLRAFEEYTHVK